MAEPIHEQIMVAIQGLLAGIVGNGGNPYWYTPAAVIRSPSFHGGCLHPTHDVVFVLVPDRTLRRKETTRTLLGNVEFDVVALKRLPQAYADQNPFAAASSTLRETYQARLAADVERKLIADPTLTSLQGLGVSKLEITSDDRSAEDTAIEGWACAFLRAGCEYRYGFQAP